MCKTLITALMLTGCFSVTAQAASFDCAKASSATEKLICGNETLSKLDEQLASIYKRDLQEAIDKDTFKKNQLAWLKYRDTCPDVACLTERYKGRIEASEQSFIIGQGASSLTTPLWLREGGNLSLCNQLFNLVSKPNKRRELVQSVEPLLSIKGVSLPEWKEISHDEFLHIVFPDSYKDKKITDFYSELFSRYPNFKHYRAKINYDNEGEYEYVVKDEFNDPKKLESGYFKILQDEKTLYKDADQNLYGRIFFYNNETYIFNGSIDFKYFSVGKVTRIGYEKYIFSRPATVCAIEPASH